MFGSGARTRIGGATRACRLNACIDRQIDKPDLAVADLAAGQHGVITTAQLRAAGVSGTALRRRVAAGRMHRVFRGVYAVGHPALSERGRWMAGVLAAGAGAVLSHRSAAELWGLLPVTEGRVHVTVGGTGGPAKRLGLRVHRSPIAVSGAEIRDDIPVTSPARTLLDLRASVAAHVARRARRQAEYLGLDLGAEGGDRSRSELERAFLRLCGHHSIPPPEVNARVGRFTVDFLWRGHGLVVETDGWAAHRGRQAFEDDRERDLELACAGIRVLRFTGRQIHGRPVQVAAGVKRELRRTQRAPPAGLVD